MITSDMIKYILNVRYIIILIIIQYDNQYIKGITIFPSLYKVYFAKYILMI